MRREGCTSMATNASSKAGESTNQLAQALVAIAGALSSSSRQSQRSQDPQPNRPSQSRPAPAVPMTNAKPTREFSNMIRLE